MKQRLPCSAHHIVRIDHVLQQLQRASHVPIGKGERDKSRRSKGKDGERPNKPTPKKGSSGQTERKQAECAENE